jgi:hypothetical protein
VNKQGTKPASTATEPKVGHLNQTLSLAVRTTVKKVQQWRLPILAVVVAAILAVLANAAYDWLQAQKEEALSATLYELFTSPAAAQEGYQPDEKKVAALLAEVRGQPAERHVYKTVVDYYLKTMTAKSLEESKTSSSPDPGGADSESDFRWCEDEDTAADRVLTLSETAAKEFPDDEDVQAWAMNAKTKVLDERDRDWLPEGWKFTPRVPQPVTGEPVSGEVEANKP